MKRFRWVADINEPSRIIGRSGVADTHIEARNAADAWVAKNYCGDGFYSMKVTDRG